MSTRRQFLKASAITVGGFIVPWRQGMANTSLPLDPGTIPKFVDPLPIPAILKPNGNSKNAASYKVTMSEFQQQVLPAGFPATTVWGYEGSFPGPTIEARKDKPVAVKWINELPLSHLFPVDTTLHGTMDGEPEVKTVVHLHGAHTKPQFDGYPEDWYASNESKNFAVYNYKNDQEPAALWYHDHAMGSTRTNVYAGLAGLYNIRDDIEDALNLPGGDYEVPIVIQDRKFTEDGALFYPSVLDSEKFPFAPVPSIIPVFIGDITLVNGKTWPYLEVEPRKYRFRVLNGSNSRPYRLRLVPDAAPDTSLPYHQIGTDGGLLAMPVPVGKVANGAPVGPQVTVAPAERADIVVDFSGFEPGDVITMRNLGINDFPSTESVTFIMQFRVIESSGADTSVLPAMLRPVPKLDPADAVRTRNLTLDLTKDEYGRPKFLLNNALWMDPITETPKLNTTEIWNFVNMTPNGHPMHVHLVTFGVLSRRLFDVEHYKLTGEILYLSPPEKMLPPNENGMRDMVRVPAGTVVQIIAHFDVPGRFVWHCHFLDHEDHEMMRPYEVVTGNGKDYG
jgi:spore coat protein A